MIQHSHFAHVGTCEDVERRHARHLREVQAYDALSDSGLGVPTTRVFPRTLQQAFPVSEGYSDTVHQVHKPLFKADKAVIVTLALLVLVGVVATVWGRR